MRTVFIDLEDTNSALNGTWVDPKSLRQLLEATRHRKPFLVEIRGGNGYMLQVGLGESLGCVQHSPVDGDVPYMMAVAKNGGKDEGVEFSIGGTPSPVSGKYTLAIDEVFDIADCFARSGERDSRYAWEEI
ncbi:MAG: hypothetical protein HYX27_14030 [Acidobacteria bacterium]|nr:hypothetical protein [Acidobacteriota bacterium]